MQPFLQATPPFLHKGMLRYTRTLVAFEYDSPPPPSYPLQCLSYSSAAMKWNKLRKEISSLLYWTMLSACTVGPGTVVCCSRAGAEYGSTLGWTLIVASLLAYTLNEGTVRLTIVSGSSLGQCLRNKYSAGAKMYNTGLLCWGVALSVYFGNTLYQCNNFAGGIAALFSAPAIPNTTAVRWVALVTYGMVVLTLLYLDQVDKLGIGLVSPFYDMPSQGLRMHAC